MGTQVQQRPGGGGGGPIPKIDIFLKARGSGPNLEWDLGRQNPPQRGKEKIDLAKDSGAHEIVFHLLSGGPGVDFDQKDPIWVQENGSCPPPKGSNSTQVSVVSCGANKLTIQDSNSGEACDLIYQLNFTGGAPACDPIISNGGGFGP